MPPPPPEGSAWPAPRSGRLTFQQVLTAAVAELSTTGYVDPDRIDYWLRELRAAAEHDLGSEVSIDQTTRRAMGAIYDRLVERGRAVDYVPGVTRFQLSMLAPKLRSELDRRILASTGLIKLNRQQAVERTLQRFAGWSTSIPPGGDETADRRETKADIGKSVAQFRYERRRVDIDQSHKLIANINEIVAHDAGAIAAEWHSHGEHDRSYNARKDHLARAGKVYAVRGCWAVREGLMNKGAGYTDEITAPGQEPFCRCFYRWITSPRRLPDEMLNNKGREWIERGRMERAA